MDLGSYRDGGAIRSRRETMKDLAGCLGIKRIEMLPIPFFMKKGIITFENKEIVFNDTEIDILLSFSLRLRVEYHRFCYKIYQDLERQL